MNIPMVDLKLQYQTLKSSIDEALLVALQDSRFILGPNLQAFEQAAADYLGVKHAIGVASGTDALHLALRAAGIGPGDQVITTPFTFIATAEAIRYLDATPVFVDIDPHSFNIDLNQVERAITRRTRAVIPVHLFGQPVDMPRLRALTEHHQLKLVEDCAQSFGAHIDGRQTGSFGDAGAFSFFPSKNLGCYGDGGLVSCNDDALAAHVKSLRNHGSQQRYYHNEIGFNSRLDELQAVILRAKLPHIDTYNRQRRRVAEQYAQRLADTDIRTPVDDGNGYHVYHQYTCLHPQREQIIEQLQRAGIGCAVYYPVPLHRQPVFADACRDLHLRVSESVASQCFSLPIYPELSEKQIDIITETVRSALK